MRTLYERHKWMQIVFGSLFLVAGVLIIVFSFNDKERIATWLSVIYAISLFLFGASCIFSGIFSLKNKYFDPAFIYGDLAIALGVVLCVHNQMIGDFIVLFVGTILTTIGVVFLGEAVSMIFFHRPKISIVSFFLLGAAFLTLGILSYVFSTEAQVIIYVGVGAVMCLIGLVQIIFGIYATVKAKQAAKEFVNENTKEDNPEVIDVQPDQIEQQVEEDNPDNNNTDA